MGTPEPGPEAALAEFAALRQEILARQAHQHTLLALQVTIGGAVFSFALSAPGRAAALLVVPFTSFMLLGRYVAHYAAIAHLSTYIKSELSPRVAGGLGWEAWFDARRRPSRRIFLVDPLFIAYPGMALLALAATAVALAPHRPGAVAVVAWCGGLALTGYATWLAWRIRSHVFPTQWSA